MVPTCRASSAHRGPAPLTALTLLIASLLAVPARAADFRLDEKHLDEVMRQALDRHELPGAVILIVHGDRVVFRKAYGRRSLRPAETPMTVDTVFDLASLTKPVATATSVMLLVERCQLRLTDRVAERVKAKYGSEFYEAIGRKGGEATKSKYGPSFYEEIGAKGGQKLKRTTKTSG